MKSKFLIIIFLIASATTKAQQRTSFPCNILNVAVSTDTFFNTMLVPKTDSQNLVLIDTNFYFKNCDTIKIQERILRFERVLPYKINKINPLESINKIVLFKVDYCKGKYTLHFWRPVNNAVIVQQVHEKKKNLIVKTISYGAF